MNFEILTLVIILGLSFFLAVSNILLILETRSFRRWLEDRWYSDLKAKEEEPEETSAPFHPDLDKVRKLNDEQAVHDLWVKNKFKDDNIL